MTPANERRLRAYVGALILAGVLPRSGKIVAVLYRNPPGR
jgi:hypothetical protein